MHLWPSIRLRDSFKNAYLKNLEWNLYRMNSQKQQENQSSSSSSSSNQQQKPLLDQTNNSERFVLVCRELLMVVSCCYCCFCCGEKADRLHTAGYLSKWMIYSVKSNVDQSHRQVMRILRSAMDKAHQKVQSQDGPIEFLHARSTFYELAAILVEGGLYIVKEEMDFLEGSPNKILSDLLEIKHWLHGRIKDMKQLIIEKDRELNERLENETKLRKALELSEKELAPGKVKNEELATDGHISKLKNSLDQQVWNLKQKLEDEEKILITDTRKITSHVSSPDLSFEVLNSERDEFSGFTASDEYFKMNHLGSADQNVLIKRMSSDIDVLKETLDLAFGTLQSAEVLPLEKQWRCTVEKDIEYILMKGFVSGLNQRFDLKLLARVGLSMDNWFDFINEMKFLCYDLKALSSTSDSRDGQTRSDVNSTPPRLLRTSSEPDISDKGKLSEEGSEGNVSHYVAKMIKNHESVIQKQSKKWNWLQSKGSSSLIKRNNDRDGHERRLQDAITRLENLITRNHMFGDKICVYERRKVKERSGIPKSGKKTDNSFAPVQISEQEIRQLKEDNDALRLQISLMEEIYQIVFQGMVKDKCFELCVKDTEKFVANDINPLPPNMSSIFQKNERNKSDMGFDDLQDSTSIYLESLIKEDIYMVCFRETMKQWNRRSKESTPRFRRCNTFTFQEGTPRSMRLIGDNSQESTPRSRKLDPDGEESLIQKLDSLARCLEVEEDLMLKASSEIKEHSVNNNLVISNCEELEERDAIEWLLTDDESMFTSVSEKLERALKQLYTSKELLVELEESLDVSDDFQENEVEREESSSFLQHGNDQVLQMNQADMVLAQITQFQKVVRDFEQMVHVDLEGKCLRLEGLKHEVETLIQPVALIRTRKSVYKKAFISRCHNLKLAESEVDLLADQVESHLSLLEKIYSELNTNATLLSQYFGVFDILHLIWTELKKGTVYTKA